MGHHQKVEGVRCAVVTVSDTRTPETDTSGGAIRELLTAAGHQVVSYDIVRDDPSLLRALVRVRAHISDALLLNGGTGLAPRDNTYEAVEGLLERRIDGFGELFRTLSYQEIGAQAMLSRAVAGVYSGRAVFAMPGSTAGVRLAMEKLVLPGLGHLIHLLRG